MIKKLIEKYPEEHFALYDNLDAAILGIDEGSMRVIYSYNKCIQSLETQGMTNEEAKEYFDFNIGCAYVGDRTPIICYEI